MQFLQLEGNLHSCGSRRLEWGDIAVFVILWAYFSLPCGDLKVFYLQNWSWISCGNSTQQPINGPKLKPKHPRLSVYGMDLLLLKEISLFSAVWFSQVRGMPMIMITLVMTQCLQINSFFPCNFLFVFNSKYLPPEPAWPGQAAISDDLDLLYEYSKIA